MSSVQGTIATVNGWKSEISALTSTGGVLDCDALQHEVDTYVSSVTDLIAAKSASMAELISQYAPIMSLPSDPLKILKWAKKVVTGIAGPAIAAAIELAIDIAQLAGAIAGIAGAVANLALELAECISDVVENTLNQLADSVMNGAITIKDAAVGIYESLKDQALDQLGYDEIVALSNDVSSAVDTVTSTINEVSTTVSTVQSTVSTIENIQIPG